MSVSIHEVAKKYSDSLNLDTTVYPHVNIEYVWIKDNCFAKLASKTRTLPRSLGHALPVGGDIPRWVFNIRTNRDSWDIGYLQPVLVYRDPFRFEKNLLTLCDTFLPNGYPTEKTKIRMECKSAMESGDLKSHDVRFEIEQEFVFFEQPEVTTITEKDCTRKALESFYRACNYMGISMNSFSIENHPEGFLSYKIGPGNGLEVSDELWMSRYVLRRVAEEFHLMPSFGFLPKSIIPRGHRDYDPRTHYSFSTHKMRNENGLDLVESCIKKIQSNCTLNLNTNDHAEDDVLRNTTVKFLKVDPVEAKAKSYYSVDVQCPGDRDPYVMTKAIVIAAFS